jgi:hypothetical protein
MPDQFETGTKQVHIKSVGGQLPTQSQSQLTPQEKTLSSVTVNAGITTNFTANAIDMDGFCKVGIAVTATASHAFAIASVSSPDGSATVSNIATQASSTGWGKHAVGECPTNYAMIQITNNDAATQTYNAWTRKWN